MTAVGKYSVTIGLETHVQLATRSKMFCACSTVYGAAPNTQVCPVCLGYPGVMPVMNRQAVRLTVLTGLMLGSRISSFSKFDRKSYFYPDMPKNYQISQYDKPLCEGGSVEIVTDGGIRPVAITRIHLEEDVAKNVHVSGFSGVDFNRAGVPLMEIVTEPDLSSPEEAFAYLQALKQILLYAGVSDCNLEEGNVRSDVNCSVRPVGRDTLGVKTEIKNMNTFKGVYHALQHEVRRQVEVIEGGGEVVQETRRWDVDNEVTVAMRSKEYAHDYRYFPEPDLMPVVLAAEELEELASALPELPQHRRERFRGEYGLPAYDAGVLVADKAVADFFEAVAALCENRKAVSNWIMTEVLRLLSEREIDLSELPLAPRALADLVGLVDSGRINAPTAKQVFARLCSEGGDPAAIVEAGGLTQVSDSGALAAFVEEAMGAHPGPVADYRAGKQAAAQFLVGQVMRLSRGKADPKLVLKLLREKLEN